jgi:hypothetical protein
VPVHKRSVTIDSSLDKDLVIGEAPSIGRVDVAI